MALDFQYDELMFSKSTVKNSYAGDVVYGYEFEIMYPSYRGTFLSCIEKLTVKLDGVEIDQKKMRFTLNGKQFLISELPTLCHEYWFVLDRAVITVLQDAGIPAGAKQIDVEMVHRIPYTGYFGEYLTLTSHGTLQVDNHVTEAIK